MGLQAEIQDPLVVPQTSVFRQLLSDPTITPGTPFSTLVQRMATVKMASAPLRPGPTPYLVYLVSGCRNDSCHAAAR